MIVLIYPNITQWLRSWLKKGSSLFWTFSRMDPTEKTILHKDTAKTMSPGCSLISLIEIYPATTKVERRRDTIAIDMDK